MEDVVGPEPKKKRDDEETSSIVRSLLNLEKILPKFIDGMQALQTSLDTHGAIMKLSLEAFQDKKKEEKHRSPRDRTPSPRRRRSSGHHSRR